MDEELNRAIDRALDELSAVRPAPDFLPRLRAHVERAARLEAPIRWWIPFSASATAVVAGVIVASLFRAPPVGHSTRSVEAPAATAVPALAPNAAETPGLIVAVVDRVEQPANRGKLSWWHKDRVRVDRGGHSW